MEPRLRNSSGPVEAMPKHKQAGHTTVLTKYAQTPQKTLAMQEPPTQDLRPTLAMLQAQPAYWPFPTGAKSSRWRTHTLRDKPTVPMITGISANSVPVLEMINAR